MFTVEANADGIAACEQSERSGNGRNAMAITLGCSQIEDEQVAGSWWAGRTMPNFLPLIRGALRRDS